MEKIILDINPKRVLIGSALCFVVVILCVILFLGIQTDDYSVSYTMIGKFFLVFCGLFLLVVSIYLLIQGLMQASFSQVPIEIKDGTLSFFEKRKLFFSYLKDKPMTIDLKKATILWFMPKGSLAPSFLTVKEGSSTAQIPTTIFGCYSAGDFDVLKTALTPYVKQGFFQ